MKVKVVIAKFGTVEFEGDANDLKTFSETLPDLLRTMRQKRIEKKAVRQEP